MYKNKSYLSIQEVSQRLSLSKEMIYKLVQKGEIPAIQIGSSWRIDPVEFEEWLANKKGSNKKFLIKEVIGNFCQALKKEFGARFSALYVFGSQARGTATSESDVDTLVVLKNSRNRWKDIKRVREIAYNVSFEQKKAIVISSIMTTEAAFLSRKDPLFYRIHEEGIQAA